MWSLGRCSTFLRKRNSDEGGERTLKEFGEKRGKTEVAGEAERENGGRNEPQVPGSWCNYRAASTQREERDRKDKKSFISCSADLHLFPASVQPSAPVCQLDGLHREVSHFTWTSLLNHVILTLAQNNH